MLQPQLATKLEVHPAQHEDQRLGDEGEEAVVNNAAKRVADLSHLGQCRAALRAHVQPEAVVRGAAEGASHVGLLLAGLGSRRHNLDSAGLDPDVLSGLGDGGRGEKQVGNAHEREGARMGDALVLGVVCGYVLDVAVRVVIGLAMHGVAGLGRVAEAALPGQQVALRTARFHDLGLDLHDVAGALEREALENP